MIEALTLLLAFVAGGALGAVFFGGLWWTVRKGVMSPRPAVWFFGSMIVRTAIVLVGFYLVGANHWDRMLSCLAGFILARLAVTWLTGRPANSHAHATEEGGHAS